MSLKKSWMLLKKSVLMKRFARAKKSPRFMATVGAAVFLAVIGVVAAAMLIAAREPSRAAIPPEKATAEATAKKVSTRLAADMTPAHAPAESAANAPVPKPAAVSITGCLERHDETFRLNGTTGVDAPKSRSWKSGFLKKGSASIAVVDAANRLKLTDHVGQRVTVTGVLVDREMQVRSLQRVAASCS
jgi:hypothetical protein